MYAQEVGTEPHIGVTNCPSSQTESSASWEILKGFTNTLCWNCAQLLPYSNILNIKKNQQNKHLVN